MLGMDTNKVWEYVTGREPGSSAHQQWIHHSVSSLTNFCSDDRLSVREKYATFLYSRLFEPSLHRQGMNCRTEIYMFGISRFVIGRAAYPVLERSSHCLVDKDKWMIVPNFTPHNFHQLVEILLKFNVCPTFLGLNLCRTHGRDLRDVQNKHSSCLIELFTKCNRFRNLAISLRDKVPEHVFILKLIFDGLTSEGSCQLRTLELKGVRGKSLTAIEPYLSVGHNPKCHTGLTSISITIGSMPQNDFASSLLLILRSQTSLQTFDLVLKRVYFGIHCDSFSNGLSELFRTPQFENLTLSGPCDLDIVRVVSGFFLCDSSDVHHVLEITNIDLHPSTDNLPLKYPLPAKEFSMHNGHNKQLLFQNVKFELSFLEWLFSMPCIRLRKLAFKRCTVVDASWMKIEDHFEQHPEFHVDSFICW